MFKILAKLEKVFDSVTRHQFVAEKQKLEDFFDVWLV